MAFLHFAAARLHAGRRPTKERASMGTGGWPARPTFLFACRSMNPARIGFACAGRESRRSKQTRPRRVRNALCAKPCDRRRRGWLGWGVGARKIDASPSSASNIAGNCDIKTTVIRSGCLFVAEYMQYVILVSYSILRLGLV